MTDLFETPVQGNDQPESFMNELVGEGKKFADVEALAKGKWHSDKYATKLESENEELRKELERRLTIEEYIQKTNQSTSKTSNDDSERDDEVTQALNQLNPDKLKGDVLEQVKQLLETQKKQSTAESNVAKVRESLQSIWGPSFAQKLNERAVELHMSQDDLGKLAETNPQAFLAIVAPKAPQRQSHEPPRSTRNMPQSQGSGDRTKSYYDRLKQENPRAYLSREIQIQEHKDAIRLGAAFFDN